MRTCAPNLLAPPSEPPPPTPAVGVFFRPERKRTGRSVRCQPTKLLTDCETPHRNIRGVSLDQKVHQNLAISMACQYRAPTASRKRTLHRQLHSGHPRSAFSNYHVVQRELVRLDDQL